MNLVIDTSVIIAVIANEPEKADLLAKTQGADLFAPNSVHWEVGNALSAMLKRQRIALDQAIAAIMIYEVIPLNLINVDLVQAVKLSGQLNIYAYDAYVIACALDQDCPLLSLDGGLVYAAKAAGADVVEVN